MTSVAAANRFIGASVKRKEDPRLLSGHGNYIDDMVIPGMLHAAFVRSPVARARINRVDAEAARALPGVRAVLTAAELNGLAHDMYSTLGGPGSGPPMRALADDMVRYVGDPVAIVIAESRYVAEDGADLVDIDLDPLPPVLGYDAALDGSEYVHPELGTNIAAEIPPADNGVDEILSSAAHVITETFVQHRHVALPMETRGVMAKWDPYDEEMTVWTSTQGPHDVRAYCGRLLAMPEHRIRVVMGDVGGGFGQKGGVMREDICVVLAAKAIGGTVKWIEDRAENLIGATHAREEQATVTIAVDSDGTILAIDVDHLEDVGAYPSGGSGSTGGLVGMMFSGPYRVPKIRFHNRAVYTNTTGRGPYRGPWMFETVAREAKMDVVARRIGMDPLELRRKNVIHQSELPFANAAGMPYDSISPEETLEQAAGIVGYDDFRRRQAEARAEGRYLGIGIGLYVEPNGFGAGSLGTEGATLRIDPAGKVTIIMSAASHGQSLETTMPQVVADHLGVDVDDVRYIQGDTAFAPYGGGTGGSRSAVITGGVARKSALEMRDKVLNLAAQQMEAAPEDLEMNSGVISVKGTPTKSMTLEDIATTAYYNHLMLPQGTDFALEVSSRYRPDNFITWSNACHFCVVEVDPATGKVEVERYVVSEDCGTMINPMVVEGQIAGGVVQGIGGVLLEHFVYDDEGNPLTTTLLDYLPPSITEVPVIEYGHIETRSGRPDGVKGMGEGGAIGSPPAVINAVTDALAPLGIDAITKQPLSPSFILDLLAEAAQ
jgi:carbon-monoxide dehydrogenase large subunit